MGWPGLLFGVLRHPIFFLLALLVLAWSLVAVNDQGYRGPPQKPDVQVIASVTLQVVDNEEGGVIILLSDGADPIVHYDAGEGSFFRGVMRTLVRERLARSIIDKPEFVLELTSQGGLILVDELTGYWIAIEAFGPDNYREFRSIFDKARESMLVVADRN
ncbi:MAG: photosynthetic complex assembly protein PuhC [Pseudomonadota bacterium]|nr:photosynthetic complex assembly protein PuhC [Pseudomonadota bacterium]